jgi:uncharacterized protein (DUF983 family)
MPMADYPAVSPASAGLRGRCPHCGRGKLFRGFLDVAERCSVCGLSYAFADAGDGPAFFVSFAAMIVAVGLALVLDAAYEPPIWLLMLILLPLVLVLCLGTLRPIKGLIIGLQYRNKAEQGRIAK